MLIKQEQTVPPNSTLEEGKPDIHSSLSQDVLTGCQDLIQEMTTQVFCAFTEIQ